MKSGSMTEVFIFGSMTVLREDNKSVYYPGFLSNILGTAVPRQTSFFASPAIGSAITLKDFIALVPTPQAATLLQGYTAVSSPLVRPHIAKALYYQKQPTNWSTCSGCTPDEHFFNWNSLPFLTGSIRAVWPCQANDIFRMPIIDC